MMKKLRNIGCVLVIFLTCMSIPAEGISGSIFSRSGIGLLRYSRSAMTFGMGGVGIASVSRNSLPYLNPAGLSFINLTRFEGSFLYEKTDVSFTNDSGRYTRAHFNSFQVAFPVKSGYGIGIGLLPYSDVSYSLSRTVAFPEDEATESLTGTGGLEHGIIHFGGKVTSWLAIGAGLDVYFGRIEKTWRVFFEEGSVYENTRDEVSSYMSGVGGHAGLILKISKKINGGAVFYFPANLDLETKTEFRFGEESNTINSKLKLPLSHGYGLNFTPHTRFQAGVDIFFRSWSRIEPEDFLSQKMKNTRRLGLGFSYKPSNDLLAGLFSRMSYRFGFSSSTLPFANNSAEQIQENLFSFGFTLPFNLNISKVDFGFEYGKRGSIDKNLAEETVFRFQVGVTGGEKWFIRRR